MFINSILNLMFQRLSIPAAQHFNLLDYNFSDFLLDDDDTLRASIRMFMDLNFLEKFNINYEVFKSLE